MHVTAPVLLNQHDWPSTDLTSWGVVHHSYPLPVRPSAAWNLPCSSPYLLRLPSLVSWESLPSNKQHTVYANASLLTSILVLPSPPQERRSAHQPWQHARVPDPRRAADDRWT